LLHELGVDQLMWQLRSHDQLYTWDRMHPGFLEHYYGPQWDQPCAVAEAIRQRWQNFTFSEAREEFSHRPNAREAEKIWQAFGIQNGAVFLSGRGESRSTLVVCTSTPDGSILQTHIALFVAAAWKLHQLLANHPDVIPISRSLIQLSPKQLEVLRVQIDNPELTLAEQAKVLNISRRMLEKRHNQIAAKFGVSSFTSAVMIAVKS